MRIKYLLICLLISFNLFAEESPKQLIEKTVDEILVIAKKYPGDSLKTKRLDLMREVVFRGFDFQEMSKRSLGAIWKTQSKAGQSEFVDLFSKLLSRTYINRLDQLKENMVDFTTEKIRDPKALIKTIVNLDGEKFPIDYKLIHRKNGWKVYDVIIENVGLVNNYRSEFASIVRKEKFTGLLESLRKKVSG